MIVRQQIYLFEKSCLGHFGRFLNHLSVVLILYEKRMWTRVPGLNDVGDDIARKILQFEIKLTCNIEIKYTCKKNCMNLSKKYLIRILSAHRLVNHSRDLIPAIETSKSRINQAKINLFAWDISWGLLQLLLRLFLSNSSPFLTSFTTYKNETRTVRPDRKSLGPSSRKREERKRKKRTERRKDTRDTRLDTLGGETMAEKSIPRASP